MLVVNHWISKTEQTIPFDELKTDYKNPIEQCQSLNPLHLAGVLPAHVLQPPVPLHRRVFSTMDMKSVEELANKISELQAQFIKLTQGTTEAKTPEPTTEPAPKSENPEPNKPFEQVVEQQQKSKPEKIIENFESIESALASGSGDISSKTPEPFAPSRPDSNATEMIGKDKQNAKNTQDLPDILSTSEDDIEWEVEAIQGVRIVYEERKQYLIKWKKSEEEEEGDQLEWVLADKLSCADKVRHYEEHVFRQSAAMLKAGRGRGRPRKQEQSNYEIEVNRRAKEVRERSKSQVVPTRKRRVEGGGQARHRYPESPETPQGSGHDPVDGAVPGETEIGSDSEGAGAPGRVGRSHSVCAQGQQLKRRRRTTKVSTSRTQKKESSANTPARDDPDFYDTSYNPATPGYGARNKAPQTPGGYSEHTNNYSPHQQGSSTGKTNILHNPVYKPSKTIVTTTATEKDLGEKGNSDAHDGKVDDNGPTPPKIRKLDDPLRQSEWQTTGIEVIIKESHPEPGLRRQTGVIRNVLVGTCAVFLVQEERTVNVQSDQLVPTIPKTGDRVKIIGTELFGIVKLRDSKNGCVEINGKMSVYPLRSLAKMIWREARNELESYAYSLKNQIQDKDKLGAKLSDDDKTKIEEAVNESISWMESNGDADSSEFKKQKKELEDLVQLYQQGGAGAGGGGGGAQDDKDEL